jgi:hypothetical protein
VTCKSAALTVSWDTRYAFRSANAPISASSGLLIVLRLRTSSKAARKKCLSPMSDSSWSGTCLRLSLMISQSVR